MKLKLSDVEGEWPNDLIYELRRNNVEKIVPFKELNGNLMKKDVKVVELPSDFVIYIIRNLKSFSGKKPYKNANIELIELERLVRKSLYSYQTFVQEDKLKKVKKLVELEKPSIILYGNKASLYFPPIIDVYSKQEFLNYLNCLDLKNYDLYGNQKEDVLVIRDGTHRIYNWYKGESSLSLVISVELPNLFIPSLPISIDKLKVVKEKPKIEERYLYLNKNYWIDLKGSGIDG